MSALDLLLGNEDLLKKPQKTFVVRRLSTESVDFRLTLESVTMNQFKHIQEMCTNKKGEIDSIQVQVMMLTYGAREFNPRAEEYKEALNETINKLGVGNAEGLVSKVLLPGEIAEVASAITELSGFGGDTIKEIKNS